MKNVLKAATAAIVAVSAFSNAAAGQKFALQPVPVGYETVRFQQGVPTLDLQMDDGAVQVTPLPMDHGSLAFSVAVYNDGKVPANIDITNFDIHAGQQQVAVFSREQLEKKAKSRAMWTQIALAAAGGLAAAAAASQQDHYSATTYTPHGTYRTFITTPSAAGQVQAAVAAGAAGAGIAAVQNQLDRTREALGATTVQLTTVDPGDSYGGRIVLEKLKSKALPQRIDLTVNWNGRAYPFAFQLAKNGTPQPVFPAPRPRDMSGPAVLPTAPALPAVVTPTT